MIWSSGAVKSICKFCAWWAEGLGFFFGSATWWVLCFLSLNFGVDYVNAKASGFFFNGDSKGVVDWWRAGEVTVNAASAKAAIYLAIKDSVITNFVTDEDVGAEDPIGTKGRGWASEVLEWEINIFEGIMPIQKGTSGDGAICSS